MKVLVYLGSNIIDQAVVTLLASNLGPSHRVMRRAEADAKNFIPDIVILSSNSICSSRLDRHGLSTVKCIL